MVLLVLLDHESASLVGDGAKCALQPDDLLERVWPVMMVEEAALHVQVSTLRKVNAEAIVAVHTAKLTGCSIEPAQPRGPVPCTLPRAIIAS